MISKNLKIRKKRTNMGQIISKEKKQKREGLMSQMKSKTEVWMFYEGWGWIKLIFLGPHLEPEQGPGLAEQTEPPSPAQKSGRQPGQRQPHCGAGHLPPEAGQGQRRRHRQGAHTLIRPPGEFFWDLGENKTKRSDRCAKWLAIGVFGLCQARLKSIKIAKINHCYFFR